jgi:hypothetical protein
VDRGPKVTFYGQNLKILNPVLYAEVRKQSEDPLEGRATIFTNKLDPDIREQLMEALVLLNKMPAPGSVEENDAMNKVILDKATRQAKLVADKNAAIARLDEYGRVRGLLPSDKNVREITHFIETSSYIPENERGLWTPKAIDLAVSALSRLNHLEFGKVETAPAPPPVQEPTITLPDGSKQLPLGTTPARHHSIAQLRDLDARERAARGRGGWHGAKF